MSLLKEIDTQEILHSSRMGLWRVELEDGQPPRFYADAVMDLLLGAPANLTVN